MISIEAARELLDFAGGTATHRARLSAQRAEEQLEGAVAIHNILEQKPVAYLADEVGLGKTYVALGAFALFRHFNPQFRILVIAPKENIQRKWIKEMRNFVRNNVRIADLRVKAIQGAPARPPVYCSNLFELIRETSLDPDRDFFARLTSFSFGLADGDVEGWKRKRDRLLEFLPWLKGELFDLHSKEQFKKNYARAICCALPFFDLVIVDEGHNLKHGLHKGAALRNRLVALTFGRQNGDEREARAFLGYGPRARRVLFLSATPIEDDYRQIWNQLDVFGYGDVAPRLADRDVSDEEKRKIVSEFLVRRVSSIDVGKQHLTKNLYRREWRAGGVALHDQPLPTPGDRQRLIVALVQKKVSELLASERFNHSFQIGMLASFESFLRTAKIDGTSEIGAFDDGEQTDDMLERQGIDVHAVNHLGESYQKNFGRPMPHPKMDALVENLRSSFDTGRKALIFVRRVASVKEISQKLDTEYNDWLFSRLRTELRPELLPKMERVIKQYRDEGSQHIPQPVAATADHPEMEELLQPIEDIGGSETFFAWYFRGAGPHGVLSGAAVSKRFNQPRFALSSFFADNYAADLLDVAPGSVFDALQRYTRMSDEKLRSELERRAGDVLRRGQKRRRHHDLFSAFQHAAISLLSERQGRLHEPANVILHDVFHPVSTGAEPAALGDWLERPTFFTELRKRETLSEELWLPHDESRIREYAARFRRRELRRELIASLFRLGHAFIDLYVAVVNRLGRLEAASVDSEDLDNTVLAADVLSLLEQQRGDSQFRAFRELREVAANFDLIVDVNVPDLWNKRLDEVRTEIGNLLRAQQPVAGMSGQVNQTVVRQFRMPGYPFVLTSTDLLQEGEDLHLFCSDVYHYGISWMPSSMEQRIGRIDRIRSLVERRLNTMNHLPDGDDLLQVYYPFLRETVEVFQVNRVLDRMNRFIRLMHENLGTSEEEEEKRVNLLYELQGLRRPANGSQEPLRSAFPVKPEMLRGRRNILGGPSKAPEDLLQRFFLIQEALAERGVNWKPRTQIHARVGAVTANVDGQQQFTIFLHSVHGFPNLRCVSPIGHVDPEAEYTRIIDAARLERPRIAFVYDARFHRYNAVAESDVLLGEKQEHDVDRAWWLVKMTCDCADRLQSVLIDIDQDIAHFSEDLDLEPEVER